MEPWERWKATSKTVYEGVRSVYSRSAVVKMGVGECEICEQETKIMSIDTSDGEYVSFDCCKPCFDKLWEKNHVD